MIVAHKWMTLGVAYGLAALLLLRPGNVDAGDWVILRFDGIKTLPHENQLVLEEFAWEPGDATETRVRYILACDSERRDVYCYALESLWGIDIAKVDEEWELMHLWQDAGVLSYSNGDWRIAELRELWSMNGQVIFADVFELSQELSKDELVEAIHQWWDNRVFTGSAGWTRDGNRMRHRSTAKGRLQIVVNTIDRGEVISAVRAEKKQGAEDSILCKSIILNGGKPWEIREGQITVERSQALPEEIQRLVGSGGTTLAEKWSSVTAESGKEMVAAEPFSGNGVSRLGWQKVLLVFCVVGFVSSVVIRSFAVSKWRVSHKKA